MQNSHASKPKNQHLSKPPSASHLNLSYVSNDSLVIHNEDETDIDKPSDSPQALQDQLVNRETSDNLHNPNFFHKLSLKFYGNEANVDESFHSDGIYEIQSEFCDIDQSPTMFGSDYKPSSQDDKLEVRSLTDLPSVGSIKEGKKSFSKAQYAALGNLIFEEKGSQDNQKLNGKTLLLTKGKLSCDFRTWNLVKSQVVGRKPSSGSNAKVPQRFQNKSGDVLTIYRIKNRSSAGQTEYFLNGIMKIPVDQVKKPEEEEDVKKEEGSEVQATMENNVSFSIPISFSTDAPIGTFMNSARRTKVARTTQNKE